VRSKPAVPPGIGWRWGRREALGPHGVADCRGFLRRPGLDGGSRISGSRESCPLVLVFGEGLVAARHVVRSAANNAGGTPHDRRSRRATVSTKVSRASSNIASIARCWTTRPAFSAISDPHGAVSSQ